MDDWEVLSNAEPDLADSDDSVVESPRENFEGIDRDAEGIIRHDYFSLENQGKYGYAKAVVDVSEEGSVVSDNPSWIDPGSVIPYGEREPGGFWSDSVSDRSDGRKSNDFDVKNELGFAENEERQVGFGEMEAADEKFGKLRSGEGVLSELDSETQVRLEEIEEMRIVDKDLGKFWSDSGGDGMVSVKFEKVEEESERGSRDLDSGENNLEKDPDAVESQSAAVEEVKSEAKSGGEVVKKTILWWKVPLEVLKYCLFRVSPVWSVSVAAAVMGLVFLGRRMYKMKGKTQSLKLNVTLDDKKVSQFMSRAARLNEAFSVVKRVPVLGPSLPAVGVNPWPVMSFR